MGEHPSATELDEYAMGHEDGSCLGHIRSCAACQAYVERFRAANLAFIETATLGPEAFADKIRQRTDSSVQRRRFPSVVRASLFLAPAMAAAAIVVFVVHGKPLGSSTGPADLPDPNTGMFRPSQSNHFKGAIPLAVVIQRAGEQQRSTGETAIEPGDRMRVEVTTEEEQPLLVGVLTEDGAWMPLLLDPSMESGLHFSPDAVHFDDNISDGWVLAGLPQAVERARKTRDFRGLSVLRLRATKIVNESQ